MIRRNQILKRFVGLAVQSAHSQVRNRSPRQRSEWEGRQLPPLPDKHLRHEYREQQGDQPFAVEERPHLLVAVTGAGTALVATHHMAAMLPAPVVETVAVARNGARSVECRRLLPCDARHRKVCGEQENRQKSPRYASTHPTPPCCCEHDPPQGVRTDLTPHGGGPSSPVDQSGPESTPRGTRVNPFLVNDCQPPMVPDPMVCHDRSQTAGAASPESGSAGPPNWLGHLFRC